MKVSFLGHGLSSGESVGSALIKSFSDTDFNTFSCLVGFASLSGISGIKESIQKSKQHIKHFNVFIGIDLKGTSKEALEALLGLNVNTNVFYTFSHIVFHPKIYLFEGEKRCRIILGSSNLTKPGLFQNIEASFIIDFAKPDKEGETLLSQIYDYFQSFFTRKVKNLHKLTQELIQDLLEGGIIPDETERIKIQGKEKAPEKVTRKKDVLKKLKKLFPSIKIQKPPSGFKTIRVIKKKPVVTTVKKNAWDFKGQLLWKKTSLPASDVQYQKEGTNPTGGLRLTQARWKVNGKVIDQTTYFRQNVFGKLAWKKEKTVPYVEVSEVLCNVRILGEDKGQHRFILRHKPSGEAGQGNYTTLLSWGKFGEEITKNDLRGKDFYLYAPPKGQNEPFYVEIKGSRTFADLFA
ncbi:MAG: hypothetical protein HWN65_24455 [Candidatus Helarchaeota archaeon]|nr:hypothetical protein [Candidatus Helarchaeota archaeon]